MGILCWESNWCLVLGWLLFSGWELLLGPLFLDGGWVRVMESWFGVVVWGLGY